MDRAYASGAAGSAPAAPASPSIGYPTAGNPGSGTPATTPGPYWYHMIIEELMAVIIAAGIEPAQGNLTQLLTALRSAGVFKTAPQFDNDTSVATTAFVQRALGNFSGESAHNVDTQLTGNDFGRLVIFAGSSVANRTFTLPPAAAGASGCKITFWNNSSYNLTVVPFAGDFLDTGTSVPASIVLGPGSTLVCETFSSVGWRLIEGTARLQNSREFASSVAANGYQRLPNGIIIQWMQFAKTTTASPISNSWPIAFPTALWNISGTIGGATNPNGGAISASGNTTTCTIYTTSGQPGGTIMVIGIGN